MLRSLRIKNWKSVYDEITFTMLSTRERRLSDSLARIGRVGVLPIAAVYGANAAGKSVLISTLATMRTLVQETRGRGEPLPVVGHKFFGANEPTEFGLEFTASTNDPGDEITFYYEISLDARRIHREELYQVRSRDELCLFARDEQEITLHGPLADDPLSQAHAQTVPSNRLLLEILRNADAQVQIIAAACRWFDELHIISKDSSYIHLPVHIALDPLFAEAMTKGLSPADTGIDRVECAQINRAQIPVPADELDEIENLLRASGGVVVISDPRGLAIIAREENETIIYEQLVTTHRLVTDNKERSFSLPLADESDGTARFLNLLPILYQMDERGRRGVFVIDELETSLHPALTAELVRSFLAQTGADQRRQLIFSTHEVYLMQEELLRRDEIWLLDKVNHATELTRLTDFAQAGVRKDADLVSAYLSGRLGGVPRL